VTDFGFGVSLKAGSSWINCSEVLMQSIHIQAAFGQFLAILDINYKIRELLLAHARSILHNRPLYVKSVKDQ
jgi:hypothetical protein